jgi:hypothetical protein
VTRTHRTTRDTPAPEDTQRGPIARADPLTSCSGPAILSPSTEFVGCLLNMPPADITPLLELVHDEDLAGQVEQHALALIRDLVSHGVTPTCATVLAHAQTKGISTPNLQLLTDRLIDAKFHAAVPNAAWLAGVVLEQAYRRAGIEYAIRITQAAEERGLPEFEQVLADRSELGDLWRRHRTATTGTTAPTVTDTSRSGVA